MNRTVLVLSLSMLLSCKTEKPPETTAETTKPDAAAAATSGGDLQTSVKAAMKADADPCVDFYEYACGGWQESFQLPADQVAWVRSFSEIEERNQVLLRTLLEESANATEPDRKQIGVAYAACMDEATIETRGAEPLKPLLDEIAAVKDLDGVMVAAAHLNHAGAGAFVNFYAEGDAKNPGTAILYLLQDGLGLPDRDYYLREGPEAQALRDQYVSTVATLLGAAGDTDAAASAKKVYDFELALAKIQKPQDQLQDPDETYNKIDVAGLAKAAPKLAWAKYFDALGAPGLSDVSVQDPEYVAALGKLVAETPIDTLKAYLRWKLVAASAPRLSKTFLDPWFAFYGTALVGQQELEPRWKRCTNSTTGQFGEIVGKYYVQEAFPGESKDIALDMIRRIEGQFEANLPGLEWMDEATRARAVEKAKAISNKIGYPDKWRDYSAVQVEPGKHFENTLAGMTHENQRQLGKVGKPVDKGEWLMNASDVNAYYNPLTNEIAFPAGILQPPFFDKDYPKAMNFGAIGMVMGHEITHGFDDSGRKYDASGALVEWWAPEVAARFEEEAQCVSDLYSGYELRPGLKINGELTLGENIADLGGIKQTYLAYKQWEKENGAETSPIEGVTPDQLLFVGYAQAWCTEMTPEIEQLLVTVDPHSPPKLRVNGPLSQLPEFHAAFECEAGTPMHPAEICEVW